MTQDARQGVGALQGQRELRGVRLHQDPPDDERGGRIHREIEGREIKVGVNPDLIATMERTIPLGRGGTPEDAAGAVYLLCIPESDYVSGQTLMCSGGLTGI